MESAKNLSMGEKVVRRMKKFADDRIFHNIRALLWTHKKSNLIQTVIFQLFYLLFVPSSHQSVHAVCSFWWMMATCVKLHILQISGIEGLPSILENWSTKLPDQRPKLFLYDAVFQK